MLLYDQCVAERDHEQNAQRTAEHGDDGDRRDGRIGHRAFLRPHEQSRHREDRAGCKRLAGRTDRLNHVILKNIVSSKQSAADSHRNNRRGNRRGDRQSDAESEISVRRAEHNREDDTEDDRSSGQLG